MNRLLLIILCVGIFGSENMNAMEEPASLTEGIVTDVGAFTAVVGSQVLCSKMSELIKELCIEKAAGECTSLSAGFFVVSSFGLGLATYYIVKEQIKKCFSLLRNQEERLLEQDSDLIPLTQELEERLAIQRK